MTFLWNELTILWNDLTIDWNDLTWNDPTMERNDRKSIRRYLAYKSLFSALFANTFELFHPKTSTELPSRNRTRLKKT